MEGFYDITQAESGTGFHVWLPLGGWQDFVGSAHLHTSGALLIRAHEHKDLLLGPGQWVSIQVGLRKRKGGQPTTEPR